MRNDFFNAFYKFDTIFDEFGKASFGKTNTVKPDKDGTDIEIELPGYKKDEIKIVSTRDHISISANGKRGKKEFSYTLTSYADWRNVSSKYEDGVLTIRVPFIEAEKPFEVKIS
jgi:HSP20 family molecular chaperone IbpA